MNKKTIIDSIFYPRDSFIPKDENYILISVEKNISIGARLFLIDSLAPTILYFHGNAELAQEYNSIAKMYNNHNINLIVADYRGYGLSGGEPDKENLHSDAVKVFDYLLLYLKNKGYKGKVIVMGRSLGSASACEIISKRENGIDKCIIESGFATEYPLLDLMRINPKSINYSLLDGFGNLSKLKKYKKPIYIIHADMDHIIPVSEAELMIEECSASKKEIFIVNGANHNNIIMMTGDTYFTKIKKFIDDEKEN